MIQRNEITVKVGDKEMTLPEYKKKEMTRVVPIGLFLGGVAGYLFSEYTKTTWKPKHSIYGAIVVGILMASLVQNKINNIEEKLQK